MSTEIKIPQRLRKRPKYQGMVIPYTTFIDPQTKIPDFKVNDERKRLRVILEGRCALCGEKLNNKIVFIGGISLCEGALAVDAGMHPACAQYAWEVCPFIVYGRGHATFYKDHGPTTVVRQLGVPDPPPAKMGMMTTDRYDIVQDRKTRYVYAKPGKAISVVWRTYGTDTTPEQPELRRDDRPIDPKPEQSGGPVEDPHPLDRG